MEYTPNSIPETNPKFEPIADEAILSTHWNSELKTRIVKAENFPKGMLQYFAVRFLVEQIEIRGEVAFAPAFGRWRVEQHDEPSTQELLQVFTEVWRFIESTIGTQAEWHSASFLAFNYTPWFWLRP